MVVRDVMSDSSIYDLPRVTVLKATPVSLSISLLHRSCGFGSSQNHRTIRDSDGAAETVWLDLVKYSPKSLQGLNHTALKSLSLFDHFLFLS